MSNAESGPGPGAPGDDGTPSIWQDVTARQPERDVPPVPESHPVFENPPRPAPPEPTFGEQLHRPTQGQAPSQPEQPGAQAQLAAPTQPAAPSMPYGQYQSAPGAPVFVNPDQQQAAARQAPQFVKRDGTPVGQPGQPGGAPIGGLFAQGGQVQPGGPVFVPPGGGAPVGGGVPGGPQFMHAPKGPSPVDVERPWKWWLGPLAFLIAIFGIVPAQIALAGAIAATTDKSGGMETIIEDYAHWFGVLQDACWIAIVLLLPYLVVKHLRPEQLGIRTAPMLRSIGVAGAAVFSFYVFAAVYSSALGLENTDNTMLQDTGFGDSVGKDIVFALLFTVAAPVAEELLFRSLLFRTIRDGLTSKWGPRGGLAGGAIISGLIFGGVHLGGGQDDFLPVLMLLGIVLALAYHWSGTIYVPIAIHAANNALATGFNSDPAADWIYGLIALGPLIALGTTYLIGKLISRWFRAEPKNPAPHPAEQPATL